MTAGAVAVEAASLPGKGGGSLASVLGRASGLGCGGGAGGGEVMKPLRRWWLWWGRLLRPCFRTGSGGRRGPRQGRSSEAGETPTLSSPAAVTLPLFFGYSTSKRKTVRGKKRRKKSVKKGGNKVKKGEKRLKSTKKGKKGRKGKNRGKKEKNKEKD